MIPRLFAIIVCQLGCVLTSNAAAPIELELATQRGVQITAPHEWLQLLTSIGIDNVRIRAARPGDEPLVQNRGTAERPRYLVAGILTTRNELMLPGGIFSRNDPSRLKDYFAGLAADGGESIDAPRGMFDLTEKEIESVFADLAQPVDFETLGQLPNTIVERMRTKLALNVVADAGAVRTLSDASPVADELRGLTAGTGLAILLRNEGLVMRPQKDRGGPLMYRVSAAEPPRATATAGRTDDPDMPHWPIGWEPHDTPGRTAPSLFEFLNAEIDGYTLEETLSAIGSRLEVPLYLDHAALAVQDIDPAKIQVRMPRTRTFYKRIIDRVLAQARLGSQVRIDEAGMPFLWITR